MSTDQVQLERRAGQRFDFHQPVSVRVPANDSSGCGFTQNLSARGALFFTELPLSEGDEVELTLVMPSEITLADNMPVRCRGKIRRVLSSGNGTKSVVAVHLAGYEFLPQEDEPTSAFGRISALHEHPHEDETAVPALGPSNPGS